MFLQFSLIWSLFGYTNFLVSIENKCVSIHHNVSFCLVLFFFQIKVCFQPLKSVFWKSMVINTCPLRKNVWSVHFTILSIYKMSFIFTKCVYLLITNLIIYCRHGKKNQLQIALGCHMSLQLQDRRRCTTLSLTEHLTMWSEL